MSAAALEEEEEEEEEEERGDLQERGWAQDKGRGGKWRGMRGVEHDTCKGKIEVFFQWHQFFLSFERLTVI